MECFFKRNPKYIGYRKTRHGIWNDIQITGQRLADQKAQIIKRKWLTELGNNGRLIEDTKHGVERSVIGEGRNEEFNGEKGFNTDLDHHSTSQATNTSDYVEDSDQNELDKEQRAMQGTEMKRLPVLREVDRKGL